MASGFSVKSPGEGEATAEQQAGQVTYLNAPRQAWLRAALLVGFAYFLIGWLFALPANDVQFWRISAWFASGIAYAAHIAYEHLRLRSTPLVGALHIAVAVAIGAFLLAVAGILHSLLTGLSIGLNWILALVLWPAATAIPAFLGALVIVAVLARLPWARSADSP